jgi:MFS family permease
VRDPRRDSDSAADGAATATPFRGRQIIALGIVVNALGTGLIGVYGFVVTPLIEEFGATPGQLGLGMSITIFSLSVLSPLLGPIFDRGHMKPTMLSGVAVMLAALLLLTRGTELWQLALCLSAAAAGISMFGMLPAKVMIVNWFVRKRGRALAFAYAGISLAGFAVPPLTAWLIEWMTWRGALAWLAIGAALIATPAIALLAVRRPEDVGQHPDGDRVAATTRDGDVYADSVSLREITRDPNFWLVGLGDALAMSVPVATAVFFVRHLEGVGLAQSQVALIMSLSAACGLIGKLTMGILSDRINPRLLASIALALYATGLWIVAAGTGLGIMFAAAIPLGLGGGGFLPLPPVLQALCFGRIVIGRVSGLQSILGLPFLLVSAPLVGIAASASGSFVLPFFVMGGVQVLAAAILAFVRLPPRPERGRPVADEAAHVVAPNSARRAS